MAEKIEWPHIGMTVDEAAVALRVDRKSIFNAINDNGFPARKVGKGYRIDPDAVKAWLAYGNFAGEKLPQGYSVLEKK